MKLFFEMMILIILYKLGGMITYYFQWPVPPVLTGMGILLLFLMTGVVKPRQMERSSRFFSQHMTLFFIPIIVGIIQYGEVLRQGGWHLLLILIFSTVFVLISTAFIALIFRKRREVK